MGCYGMLDVFIIHHIQPDCRGKDDFIPFTSCKRVKNMGSFDKNLSAYYFYDCDQLNIRFPQGDKSAYRDCYQ